MTPEEFIQDQIIDRGLAENTARTRLSYLNMFLRALPRQLEECSEREIKIALHQCREKYSVNTFGMLLYVSLQFMRALGMDITNIQIRVPGKENTKVASDMLTAQEVQAIIDATTNIASLINVDRSLYSPLSLFRQFHQGS